VAEQAQLGPLATNSGRLHQTRDVGEGPAHCISHIPLHDTSLIGLCCCVGTSTGNGDEITGEVLTLRFCCRTSPAVLIKPSPRSDTTRARAWKRTIHHPPRRACLSLARTALILLQPVYRGVLSNV